MSRSAVLVLTLLLHGCGGGGSGSSDASVSRCEPPTATPLPSLLSPTNPVTISGVLTFDQIPNAPSGGLDYDAIASSPLRGVTVQAYNSSDVLLAQTQSDAQGEYQLAVGSNSDVRLRVLAELRQSGSPSWNFRVTDNTNCNILYVMEGALVNAGNADSRRDLHAGSGWDGSRYSQPRVAAPFAIIDAVYEAKQLVLVAEPNVNMVASEFRWSVDNIAVNGSRSEGLIGTSFYDPSENNMYILGHVDNDTDEYDKSVIQHEWAHYLEDTLARTDSIGGNHDITNAYDMRVAFGEGFANAFSSIAGQQAFYSDSNGPGQSRGLRFSLEEGDVGNHGWYSENSVGQIIYDIADLNNDGEDLLSLGFTPIYETLRSSAYRNASAMTSIYLFADIFKARNAGTYDLALDALLQDQQIFGDGAYGEGETNVPQGYSLALPVYNILAVGGSVEVCGNNLGGNFDRNPEFNRLDNRRFVRLDIPSDGSYEIRALTSLGTGERDPEIVVWRQGERIRQLTSAEIDSEVARLNLSRGEHILEVFDRLNIDLQPGGGTSCFEVSVNPA